MARVAALPVLLTLIIVVEEGLRLALRRIFHRRRRAIGKLEAQDPVKYGGLESLVSFSACLIAAHSCPHRLPAPIRPTMSERREEQGGNELPQILMVFKRFRDLYSATDATANRAVETEQREPYIWDPLAAGLCGQEALEARRPQLQSQLGIAPGPQTVARRPIPRLIMRTKFFDDVVSVVTWRGTGHSAAAASHSCHAELAVAAASSSSQPCLQVVVLGSGLDARPWRLPLPPGVRWFEVDRGDVLAAKRARLDALGAQIEAAVGVATAVAAAETAEAVGTEASTQNGSSAGYPAQGRPLPDLDQQQQPVQKGYSGMHHTETSGDGGGGCNGSYRYPLHAASWSCCAVDLQRRGWSQGLLEQGLDPRAPVLWVLEGLLYYLEEEDVEALLKARTGPGLVWQRRAAATHESGENAAPSGGRDRVTSRPSPVGDGGGAATGAARPAGYNLNAEFKWKCREEIPKFFGGCGWRRTLACLSWLDAARSYGLPTAEATASSVFFLTAALA
ncbi:hypothetical protein VOLCADRAFT_89847 [Volvox carteri f. nagariensis]|uniref:[Phosphatase 2A protein]-leucine-carboxy methyltransferase 1 n=1 Tax=Volvox carteri f. nagariensis TaxID=3068 RepID=D8TST5_VOLCA|nr:uncharacterized protein VOLCADRAFT_89847 [Volvox carteri f. nagariensis]EFJ49541.1 hypothetical protein VOLCADRAFT_89847 [Volvox carteri f. nagariensis]|eukprot:XP_002949522.1 hypothetical protein VOLCADRAFT_89847 [Volvox carteri f. nagariensis]